MNELRCKQAQDDLIEALDNAAIERADGILEPIRDYLACCSVRNPLFRELAFADREKWLAVEFEFLKTFQPAESAVTAVQQFIGQLNKLLDHEDSASGSSNWIG